MPDAGNFSMHLRKSGLKKRSCTEATDDHASSTSFIASYNSTLYFQSKELETICGCFLQKLLVRIVIQF